MSQYRIRRMWSVLAILMALFGSTPVKAVNWATLPEIHKRAGTFIANGTEATPVVLNGELLIVHFDRIASHGTQFRILRRDRTVVATVPFAYGLGSALVVGSRLYVFGSSDWGIANNHVAMMWSDDLVTWSTPVRVLDAPAGYSIFNTSVATAPTGYVMMYETNEAVAFTGRFAVSADLTAFTPTGALFQPTTYAACPTIRYAEDGWYFITYLRTPNGPGTTPFVTFAARTRDFQNFEYFAGNSKWPNTTQVLSPTSFPSEGTNNSDVDWIEYNGELILTYAVGDQRTWTNVRTAVYWGSFLDFYHEFWP